MSTDIKICPIKLFEGENGTYWSQVFDDIPQPFLLPDPYWSDYQQSHSIAENHFLAFGFRLFEHVFCTLSRLQAFKALYGGLKTNETLVICIVSDSAMLQEMPWEIMCADVRQEQVLLRRGNIHMVRQKKASAQTRPHLPSTSPFQILLILSLPIESYEQAPIDPFRQLSLLYDALKGYQGLFKLDILESASYQKIRSAITQNHYDVIHFSGHGGENELCIEADHDYRQQRFIDGGQIRTLFQGISAKIVILDACLTGSHNYFGASVATAFEDIPVIIANQDSISDDFASVEMKALYSQIFDLQPFALLQQARNQTSLEWWKTVIYVEGAVDQSLFSKNRQNNILSKNIKSLNNFHSKDSYVYRYEPIRRVLEMLRTHDYAVLHGIGGVGKSFLADFLIEVLKGRFDAIVAIDLTQHDTFLKYLVQLVESLEDFELITEDEADALVQLQNAQRLWRKLKKIFVSMSIELLLVLDNFETVQNIHGVVNEDFRDFIADLIGSEFIGKLIVTTRVRPYLDERERSTLERIVEIGPYSQQEFLALTRSYNGTDACEWLQRHQLALEVFNYHPLVLHRALQHKANDIEAYCDKDPMLQAFAAYYLKYSQNSIGLKKLALMECAISENYWQSLNEEDPQLSDLADRLRIIKKDKSVYGIYEFIRRKIADSMTHSETWQLRKSLFEMAKASTPGSLGDLFLGAQLFAAFGYEEEQSAQYNLAIGDSLIKLSQFDHAEGYFQKALEIFKKVQGEKHPNTATVYSRLAGLHEAMGSYKNAETCNLKALSILETDTERPNVKVIYANLVSIYERMGNFEKAEYFGLKALEVYDKKPNEEPEKRVSLYNSLTGLYHSTGNYKKGEQYGLRALAICNEKLPKDHEGTAYVNNQLGLIYKHIGAYRKSEHYYHQSLKIFESRQDELGISLIYHNLAGNYEVMRNFEAAENHYLQAIRIREKNLGEEHPIIAATYNNLARLYCDNSDCKQAEYYYSKALVIRQQKLGEDHQDTATTYHDMAGLYDKIRDYEKSKSYYVKALAIREKRLGKAHQDTGTTYGNLGRLYSILGDNNEAEQYYLKGISVYEQHGNCLYIAVGYLNIATLYHDMGIYEKAKPYYLQALSLWEQEGHSDTVIVHHRLGDLFEKMDKFDQAESYYDQAVAQTKQGGTRLFGKYII